MKAAAKELESGKISEKNLGHVSFSTLRKLAKELPKDHPLQSKIKETLKSDPRGGQS